MRRSCSPRRGCFRCLEEALPADLGTAICLDFGRDGAVRLLKPRYASPIRYLFGPLAGTNPFADLAFRRYRFDMSRTVSPFVAKLYETAA